MAEMDSGLTEKELKELEEEFAEWVADGIKQGRPTSQLTRRHYVAELQHEADWARMEYELHSEWAAEEIKKGRPERELTFGNCVRETGVLQADGCLHMPIRFWKNPPSVH